MSLTFVTAAVLCAAKLAAPGLSGSGISADRASFFSEYVAAQLTQNGVEVITQKELATMLGMERQRELLGCADTACLTELSSALGTDGVLLGDIAFFANRFLVTLKVLRTRDGKQMALRTFEVANEDELLGALKRGARDLATDVKEISVMNDPGAVPVRPQKRSARFWVAAPLVASALCGVVAAALFSQTEGYLGRLRTERLGLGQSLEAYNSGRGTQAGGWLAIGLAVGGLITAVVIYIAGAPP